MRILALLFLTNLLTLPRNLQELDRHFRMRENIIVNDFLESLVGERRLAAVCRLRRSGRAAQEREQARNHGGN